MTRRIHYTLLVRVNKFLAKLGFGSRRAIDHFITIGNVLVNGTPAVLGQKLVPQDLVTYAKQEFVFEGEDELENDLEKVYLAFNKPPGIVCTKQTNEGTNVYDFLAENPDLFQGSSERYEALAENQYHHIGRLDKDSRGLMIITNDGDLTQKLTHPKYEHEKEYLVTCRKNIDDEFLKKFSEGVLIVRENDENDKVLTSPCLTKRFSENQFKVVLKQGYNRQIRKMVAALDNAVTDLFRIRISNIVLKDYLDNEMIDKKYLGNLIILDKLDKGEFIEIQYPSI